MAVTRDGKYGYIDKTGRIAIPITLEYDVVEDFHEGFAVVRIGEFHEMEILKNEKEEESMKRWEALNKHIRWGLIDKTGDLVVPPEYTSIQGFNDGIAVLGNDGKQSFIDPTGKVLFVTDFDAMGWFSEGLAVVRKGDKYNYIDKAGQLLLPLENAYSDVSQFKEGHAVVKKDGKYGLINRSGTVVVPMEYDSMDFLNEGLSVVKKDGKWGIIEIETSD